MLLHARAIRSSWWTKTNSKRHLVEHMVHPPELVAEAVGAARPPDRHGMPAIDRYTLDFGHQDLRTSEAGRRRRGSYGPRRTILDKLLVDAAAESGPRFAKGSRRGHSVRGRARRRRPRPLARWHSITERARLVIGATADTRSSPKRFTRSSTTRNRRFRPATTPTGATCP